MFLVDASKSVVDKVEEILSWIKNSLDKKSPRDSFAVVAFGGHLQTLQPLTSNYDSVQVGTYTGDLFQTDLEGALLFASHLFAQDEAGRIVLFSDGNETTGSAIKAAHLLKDMGITFDVVPLGGPVKDEVALTKLTVSPIFHEGENAKISVELESNREQTVDILITLNDRDIIREEVNVKEGKNVFTFNHIVTGTGVMVYRAEIAASRDHYVENNNFSIISRVEGKPRNLVVETEKSRLESVLTNSGFVTDVIQPVELPGSLQQFLRYDSLIFNNVPATKISLDQMSLVKQAVHDFGRGFVMIGGEESFGLGGYFRTPIEELLPVEMEVKNKKNSFPWSCNRARPVEQYARTEVENG